MNTQPIPHRVQLAAMVAKEVMATDLCDFDALIFNVSENVKLALLYADELIKQDAETKSPEWAALNELHGQAVEELLEVRAENEKVKAELEALKADKAELVRALTALRREAGDVIFWSESEMSAFAALAKAKGGQE
jgi:hypothetical protein